MVIGVELVRAEDKPNVIRIGFQKSSTLITLLKTRGEFEKGLEKLGVKVQWSAPVVNCSRPRRSVGGSLSARRQSEA